MTMVVSQIRGKPGQRTALDLTVVAALLLVVAIGGVLTPAAADEGAAGVGLAIPVIARATLVSAFESRYAVGDDGAADEEAVPVGSIAELSVVANTSDWGVAVRFTLPEGSAPKHRNAAARCRLVDEAGHVISEALIEGGEVFLVGNGRRGDHTLFLEVAGLSDALGVERLSEPMVEVEGRLAVGGVQ
jgi:hypothetical protein